MIGALSLKVKIIAIIIGAAAITGAGVQAAVVHHTSVGRQAQPVVAAKPSGVTGAAKSQEASTSSKSSVGLPAGVTSATRNAGTPAPDNLGLGSDSAPISNGSPTPTSAPATQPPPKVRTSTNYRFVDVSAADAPNTVAAEYCDYTYSDGTSNSVRNGNIAHYGTGTPGHLGAPIPFKQPIANYNTNNLPDPYSAC